MNKFTSWYTRNYEAITWFIIGWISMDLLVQFGRGNWVGCLIDIFLIAVNAYFVRQR